MSTGPWRPAKLSGDGTEKHVINQNFREINARLDAVSSSPVKRIGTPRANLNFGAIGAQTGVERTVRCNGASQQSVALANPINNLGNTALVWCAWVSAADQVTVRLVNPTGGSITPNVVGWAVGVF
jgi:hypothetical protein